MPRSKLIALLAMWMFAACFGLHALMSYKGKAGSSGDPPESWPVNGIISPSGKPFVLMFAHPKCPCTQASLSELEQLVAKTKNQAEVTVAFYQPPNSPEGFCRTALVDKAKAIPGVRVLLDQDGKLAKNFGVKTSGHTVVYGVNNKLLFSGGITVARGHEGNNAGLQTLLGILANQRTEPTRASSPVFGCDLFDRCTTSQTTQRN